MDPEHMEQLPGDKLKEDEKVTEKTPVLSGAECSIFESSTELNGTKRNLDISYFQRREVQWKEMIGRKDLSRKARSFYVKQGHVIQSFLETEDENYRPRARPKAVSLAAKISLFANICLLIAKVVAAVLSKSLSIVSSVVDSAVDLISGIIICYTSKAMKRVDIYDYPVGKTRLEPIAIVILSSIMATASIIVVHEAIENMALKKIKPDMSVLTIVIIGATIITKFLLFLYCRRIVSPSTHALAIDHINDTVSNSFALLFAALGSYLWLYADPIGAILISIYIFVNWWRTGAEQIRHLAGRSASPELLQKITWICIQHSDQIEKLDTVRTYRIGNGYLAEVDIVLPENMTLKEAHNIGEPLQQKLERLPEIERAFVHIDYEFTHLSSEEHKVIRF